MQNIDFYIKEVQEKKRNGGNHRTKVYPFREERLILVNKSEKNFKEIKNRIKKCSNLGVNIPLYLDYKYDGKDYWILEELAIGKEYESLVRDENITNIYANIPYEHMEKYVKDCYLLKMNGIGLEPRYRNIFYDKEKGFTNIDVSLYNEKTNPDSLRATSYFFEMISPVFNPLFRNDEYGQIVRERTILNTMKAFENGHPFFKKYKRWIYRNSPRYAEFLEKKGYDLSLDEKEYAEFIEIINQLINDIVNEKLNNPSDLFINKNTSYIDLLESSIAYCPQFDLFDKTQNLKKYIQNSVYNRIKSMFLENMNHDILKELYFKIRRKELDPVNIYPEEMINNKIMKELEELKSEKHKK